MTCDDDFEAVRRRVAATAAAMLNGQLQFLEGVRILTSLHSKACVAGDDDDFMTLVCVDSETDSLPVGDVRRHWAAAALQRLEPEIEAATQWARQFASGACESLLARFGG